jgi:AcrR family transcriptional regulator
MLAVVCSLSVQQRQATLPRGRHAPPLEVRQSRQRRRLFAAAAKVFARVGYADATAEAIAREAGMSKATFYEHFGNKEDCIVALFDAATEVVLTTMRNAGEAYRDAEPRDRARAMSQAFFGTVAYFPDESKTLLVEIVGAGPRAVARHDAMLDEVARYIEEFNRFDAERGAAPRLASPHDAYAIVGAAVELAARQLRTGRPEDISELEAVVERVVLGLLRA